jgi:hypothetical protein
MNLLDLPEELIARVIYLLVEDVGLIASTQYRLVSSGSLGCFIDAPD